MNKEPKIQYYAWMDDLPKYRHPKWSNKRQVKLVRNIAHTLLSEANKILNRAGPIESSHGREWQIFERCRELRLRLYPIRNRLADSFISWWHYRRGGLAWGVINTQDALSNVLKRYELRRQK